MIRGEVPWLVRALADWAPSVGQGLALVTYRSPQARNEVIEQLQRRFPQGTALIDASTFAPLDFVARVAHGTEDLLVVVNADRLIFDKDKPDAPSVVNFNREKLVERNGAQVWFMWEQAASRW